MIYQINVYLSYDVLYLTRILLVIWCLLFIFILEYKCYPIKGVSAFESLSNQEICYHDPSQSSRSVTRNKTNEVT